MPEDRSGRRVQSFTLGLSAIFDLTGIAIFRMVRPNLPEPPPIASRPDPFRSAMDTIMAAHREVIMRTESVQLTHDKKRTHDKSGVTLPACPTATAFQQAGGSPTRWPRSPELPCTAMIAPISRWRGAPGLPRTTTTR
jgi:hypothetical protein